MNDDNKLDNIKLQNKQLIYNQHKTYFKYGPLDHAIAGLTAGAISCTIIHPFDVVKIQLQVSDKYKTGYQAFKDIIKKKGVRRGLFSGLSPNLLGNVSAWGLYFLCFNHAKQVVRNYKNTDKLSGFDLLMTGTASSLAVITLTNPIWVIKTRMFLSAGNTTPNKLTNSKRPAYNSISHAFRTILKHEGIQGLYAGFSMGLISCTHGGLQFASYEKLINWRISKKEQQDTLNHIQANRPVRFSIKGDANRLSLPEFLSVVILSKAIAQIITYPLNVIRSRLQDISTDNKSYKKPYSNLKSCIKQTYSELGIRSFYRGLPIHLLRVSPQTCILFMVYEYIRLQLNILAN